MDYVLIFISTTCFTILGYKLAKHKGRNSSNWALGGFIFAPVLFILFFLNSNKSNSQQQNIYLMVLLTFLPISIIAYDVIKTNKETSIISYEETINEIFNDENLNTSVDEIISNQSSIQHFLGHTEGNGYFTLKNLNEECNFTSFEYTVKNFSDSYTVNISGQNFNKIKNCISEN